MPIPTLVTETKRLPLWTSRKASNLELPVRPTPWDRMIAELSVKPWVKVTAADAGSADPKLPDDLENLASLYLSRHINEKTFRRMAAGTERLGQGTATIHVAVLADQTFYHWIGEIQGHLPRSLRNNFRVYYDHDESQLRYVVEFVYRTPGQLAAFVAAAEKQLIAIPV